MDHSDMDHGHMDHGHGGMDMGDGPACKMNMLFNWDIENVCIVFPQWRITGWFTFLVSLVGVALLTAGYELVRELSRRYENQSSEYLNSLPTDDEDEGERSWPWLGKRATQAQQKTKTIKAALYAAQVFYSFFIMLLFMTYNGFIMFSVAVGAFIGYMVFGSGSASKTVACH